MLGGEAWRSLEERARIGTACWEVGRFYYKDDDPRYVAILT
jgi:hypothetical protein